MPNIFRKNPSDYAYLEVQRGGRSDRQFMDALKRSGSGINWNHDFSRQNFKTDAESNAAAFGLVMNNMEAMQAEIEEILRERFMIPEFVPINMAIPEGATSYALRVINRYGKGKFINNDGSNVESATASVDKLVFTVEYAGIQPEWSLQDLREVLFTGISLSNETLEAGAQGALDHIQQIGFEGDSDVGFKGLLNQPSTVVPMYGGTVPVFKNSTDDVIASFINDMIASIGVATNEIVYQHFGTTDLVVVLPTESYDHIATRRMGVDANKTIAEYLATNNVWTTRTGKRLVFKSLPRAKDAATTGASEGRVIMYPMNSRILEMAIPIMPRIITTDNSAGYRIKAPMEYSMGGVVIKRGTMMLYADGTITAAA